MYVFLLPPQWSLQDTLEDLVIEVFPDRVVVLVELFGDIPGIGPRRLEGEGVVVVVVVRFRVPVAVYAKQR